MNRILDLSVGLCLLLVLGIPQFAVAQDQAKETSYGLQEKIFYYDAEPAQLDDYIKERCFLDLYYPSVDSGFATIVWFHGGGLRAGKASVPQAFMMRMMKVAGHKQTTLFELDGYGHGGMAQPAFPLLLDFIDTLEK